MPITGGDPFTADIVTQSSEQLTLTEFGLEPNAVTRMDLVVIARARSNGFSRSWRVSGLLRRFGEGAPVNAGKADTDVIGDTQLSSAALSLSLGTFTMAVLVTGVLNQPLDWSISGTARVFKPQP